MNGPLPPGDLAMKIEQAHWDQLKPLAGRVIGSSLHFAISTINPDGTPHVTPIGSLILTDPGKAYFFRGIHTKVTEEPGQRQSGCCSGRDIEFSPMAAIPHNGSFQVSTRVSAAWQGRRASRIDAGRKSRWRRRVRLLKWTRGNDVLWGNLETVRELHFHSVAAVEMGRMTANLDCLSGE